ncbi:MAG: tail fiber domain-containing protein [Bacteroidales bacterium]|nr:tail fiber domain-containing protein [Bacteroidales bacterium]
MKRSLLYLIALLISAPLLSQAPQGFNYQAVARDSEGNALISTPLNVRIAIQNNSEVVWQEDHEVETSGIGLFSLIIGDENATKTGGSAASFSDIAWGEGDFSMEVSVYDGSGYSSMGVSPLMSVPYALYADNASVNSSQVWLTSADTIYTNSSVGIGTSMPNQSLLSIQSSDPQVEKPLFEVKNDAGIPVFAVYNDGVIVYVDENKKGAKGGFAVGGYSSLSKGPSQEYLRITPDSVRIWVPEGTAGKAVKGGFAVGGYNTAGTKATTRNFLEVTSAKTNIFFDTTTQAKGFKGGFAVGGYNAGKTTGEPNQLMSLTNANYLIGQDAGVNITTGRNNTFFGWEAGYNNTGGSENIFMGKQAGFSNLTAQENIFIGNKSGYYTEDGYGNIYLGNESGYYNYSGYFNSVIGYQAGFYSEGSYNTFLGYQAGGNNTWGENNIAIGFRAGIGEPTSGEGISGNSNIFIGNNSGAYTTSGSNNVMIGDSTGFSNTLGENNVIMGDHAGFSNNQGLQNVIIGTKAGYYNYGLGGTWDANYNVFVGYRSGEWNTSGSGNVFLGYWSGNYSETGDYQTMIGHGAGAYAEGEWNTFIGAEAGMEADTGRFNTYMGIYSGETAPGSYNTYMGYGSGRFGCGQENVILGAYAGWGSVDQIFEYNTYVGTFSGAFTTTGSRNVYLGYAAGYLNETGDKNVFIGNWAGANEEGSDKLYIDNSDTDLPLIYGDFYWDELEFNAYVYANAYYELSDGTYKKNIVPVTGAIDKLQQINGVYFDYDLEKYTESKGSDVSSIGVIAQDVEKVFPDIVKENSKGVKAVNYTALIPVLIEAIKDQQTQIEQQQAEIDALKLLIGR